MELTVDLKTVRDVWRWYFAPTLRDQFSVQAARVVSEAEVDRWAPFEALAAQGVRRGHVAEDIQRYCSARLDTREWVRYWNSVWPGHELETP